MTSVIFGNCVKQTSKLGHYGLFTLREFSGLRARREEQKGKLISRAKELQKTTITRSKELQLNVKTLIKDQGLHENVYTIPNILTFTRLVSAPLIGYLIVNQQIFWSLGVFTYSCVTDFVDGYIARRYNMKSVVGTILDPMADKSLMVICTVCLAQASQVPFYLATLIIGRDVLLGLSALYYRYISLPAPKTFLRYWDFSIPSAEVRPTTISKINTGLQMVYIGVSVLKPVILSYLDPASAESFLSCIFYFEALVASTTVFSGLSYLFSKDAVKILNQK